MRTRRLEPAGLTALLALLALPVAPGTAQAQEHPLVSNQVAVSRDDATLELELVDDRRLEISFREGEVLVDGVAVGEYEPDGSLETAWRSLLGDAVALNDGPLARALRAWEPPTDLEGDALEMGRLVDRTLEERLALSEAPAPDPGMGQEAPREDREVLGELLRRTDRLEGLAEALENLSLGDVRIHVDEDVRVEAGEELDATLVVVDGDLEVRGTVDGDVVLTDGSLRIYEGGLITGEVRLVDGRVFRNGGEIEGAVRNVGPGELEEDRESLEELRDRIRDEVRSEIRSEFRNEFRGRDSGVGFLAPLRNVGRGIAGLLQNLISLAIVGVLAVLVIHFFPEKLEVIAENARRNPGRAAVVGVAGSFLLLPVWILGMVALAISIIGIPALLAWIPLFPLAACVAAGIGYLAVARIVGQWIAEQRFQGLEFLRPSNAVHAVIAGLAAFTLPFAAANVVQMGGHWLDFVEGLFIAVGSVAGVVAVVVGFGAVLITRGGRRPAYGPAAEPFDLRWPGGATDQGPEPGEEWEDMERDARRRTADRTSGEAGPETPTEESGPGTWADDETGRATPEATSDDEAADDEDEEERNDA